jgi:CDP-diacylglycerol--serine O-phosphatidyltransferase
MKRVSLRKTLFILPNLLTMCSILCGFYALVICSGTPTDDDFYRACLLVILAAFLDSIDGRVARLTKTQSAFGLQIDSLADAISFGCAPAILVYRFSLEQAGVVGLICSFVFVGAGAVRLARFNVLTMGEGGAPTKPGKYVVGLVIPGAAGILVSLVIANHAIGGNLASPKYVWPLCGLTAFLSFLMVSTVKFRSFKDIKLNAVSVAAVLFIIGSSAVISLQTTPAFVLVWLLGCYVVLGIIESIVSIPRNRRERAAQLRAEAEAAEAAEARTSTPPSK